MSAIERDRLKVMARVKTGGIRLVEAAEILGLSYRQSKRLNRRYEEEGDPGLIHRGRGQPGNRGYDESFKREVLARYQERYPDFGPTRPDAFLNGMESTRCARAATDGS